VDTRAGEGVLQACEELGIGFVPYSPLGKGFLTGTMNEKTKLASNDFRWTTSSLSWARCICAAF
jgi:aryl-alcohol dehydrogenase-like predicted oxidoreductase